MASPRTLRITIEVEDEGGPEDYNNLMSAISAIGDIIDEEEV